MSCMQRLGLHLTHHELKRNAIVMNEDEKLCQEKGRAADLHARLHLHV